VNYLNSDGKYVLAVKLIKVELGMEPFYHLGPWQFNGVDIRQG
jgi:hypothetical protein